VTTRRTQRFRLPRLYHRFVKMRGKSGRWNSDAKDNERTRTRDRDNWPKRMRPNHSHAKQTRAANKVHAHTYHTQTHIRRSGVVFRDLSYLTVRREITPEQRQPPPPTATAATRRPPMTPETAARLRAAAWRAGAREARARARRAPGVRRPTTLAARRRMSARRWRAARRGPRRPTAELAHDAGRR